MRPHPRPHYLKEMGELIGRLFSEAYHLEIHFWRGSSCGCPFACAGNLGLGRFTGLDKNVLGVTYTRIFGGSRLGMASVMG